MKVYLLIVGVHAYL